MTIDPATLNRRLTIERYALVENDWNGASTWSDIRTVWASMKYDKADEQFNAGQRYAQRIVTFTTRFSHDITALDRVRCLNVTYEILGVTEVGNREGLVIKARALDPGGA